MTTPPAPLAPRTRERLAAALLAAFALAVLADLGSLLAGAETGHRIAKPLLMPLLAAFVAVRGGPRTLVAALLLGWGGDVFLLLDAAWAFLAGMGFFALGHLCYLRLFGRAAPPRGLGPLYAVLLVAAVALLWPGLPAELRLPVAGYAALLAFTAWRASALGAVVGAGGALFLVSDLIIATGIAGLPQPPAADFWIMFLYCAAQLTLALGVLTASARTLPGAPAPDGGAG
ncbi:lysoplasmalogenase [Streptomyces sp. NPDC020141]|uniref:lysoplasmalogenase n=1 Tax=Streptomyces sp. NPDC020141 TaxID=3365065 RepID=UPI00378A070A